MRACQLIQTWVHRFSSVALMGAFVLTSSLAHGQKEPARSRPQPALAELSRSVEELAAGVSSSVVQVFASGFRVGAGDDSSGTGVIDKTRSSGSGVLLDPEGYIVTNAHVVESAAKVEVVLPARLNDGPPRRSILGGQGKSVTAEVVGVDKETDLAVLKIPQQGLPHLVLGDSEQVRPGQLVLAFGSPLGLENSVTMGVVSATARQIRPEDPMIYIQTDTPINPGNSGGPLIDLEGRVIGINTLILSQSGGSEGIGFAAPSNIVRVVFEQIRNGGRVRRGMIGAYAQTITSELATGLALPHDWGVILGDVLPDGPGARAGLKEGDVVLTLNGKVMENARQFDVNLYRQRVGDRVSLEVARGQQRLTLQVPVIERPDDPERFVGMVSVERNALPALGVLGVTVDARIAQMLPPLRKNAGVLVAARTSGSFPGKERLLPGDIVYSVNRVPVMTLEELRAATTDLNSSAPVVIQVERQSRVRYLVIELERVRTR
jgi:serine protease Do